MTPTSPILLHALLLALLLLILKLPSPAEDKLNDWHLTAHATHDEFPAGLSPTIQVTITNTGRQKREIFESLGLWEEVAITAQRDGVEIPVRQHDPAAAGGMSFKSSSLAPGVSLTHPLHLGEFADCSLPGKYTVTLRRPVSLYIRNAQPSPIRPLGIVSASARFEVLPGIAPLTQTNSRNGLQLTAALSTADLKPGDPLLLDVTLALMGKKAKPLELTAGFFNEYQLEISRNGRPMSPCVARSAFEAQFDLTDVTVLPGFPDRRALNLATFYDCTVPGNYAVLLQRWSRRSPEANAGPPLEVLLGFKVAAP